MEFRIAMAVLLVIFISGCTKTNNNEAITQDDGISSVDEVEIEAEADPNSRENLIALTALRREQIAYRCQPYLTEAPTIANGADHSAEGFSGTLQFSSSYPDDPDLYYVDTFGEPTITTHLRIYNVRRQDFGDHHLLIQCTNSQYGVLRAFVPKVGAIGNGIASTYNHPPFLGSAGGGKAVNEATIWVSARSELVYQVFKLLALKHLDESGLPPSDTKVIELLANASSLVSAIPGFTIKSLFNDEYMFDTGGTAFTMQQAIYTEVAKINEQARWLSETVNGFNADPVKVLEEVASQIVLETKSRNYGDIIEVSYLSSRVNTISSDSRLNQLGSMWVEHNNTGASHGFSESQIFYGDDGVNDFSIDFESNVEAGLESLQHGIYQDIAVAGKDLNKIFFNAKYKLLNGIIEDPGRLSRPDDSGVAAIAIEYLDGSNNSLGSTIFANYELGLFSNLSLKDTPESFGSVGTMRVTRMPAIANNGLTVNVGREAERALAADTSSISTVRIHAIAFDFLAEQSVSHWLSGAFPTTPTCASCRAELIVNSLAIFEYR